jgi:hypothetical protein
LTGVEPDPRLVIRYEYHQENILGFVHLGCILILLRFGYSFSPPRLVIGLTSCWAPAAATPDRISLQENRDRRQAQPLVRLRPGAAR